MCMPRLGLRDRYARRALGHAQLPLARQFWLANMMNCQKIDGELRVPCALRPYSADQTLPPLDVRRIWGDDVANITRRQAVQRELTAWAEA